MTPFVLFASAENTTQTSAKSASAATTMASRRFGMRIAAAVAARNHGPGHDDRHAQVAQHECQRRRGVVHCVGAVQDDHATRPQGNRLCDGFGKNNPVTGHDVHAAFSEDRSELEIDVRQPYRGDQPPGVEIHDCDTVLLRAVSNRTPGRKHNYLWFHGALCRREARTPSSTARAATSTPRSPAR